jgi:hypothetical protein
MTSLDSMLEIARRIPMSVHLNTASRREAVVSEMLAAHPDMTRGEAELLYDRMIGVAE